MENQTIEAPFTQVCVWPACVVGAEGVAEFETSLASHMGVRIKYLEEIVTEPGDGGEGGRNDLFFALHSEDVGKFAVPRLQMGIRWIENVLSKANYRDPIYPARVFGYKSWTADIGENDDGLHPPGVFP